MSRMSASRSTPRSSSCPLLRARPPRGRARPMPGCRHRQCSKGRANYRLGDCAVLPASVDRDSRLLASPKETSRDRRCRNPLSALQSSSGRTAPASPSRAPLHVDDNAAVQNRKRQFADRGECQRRERRERLNAPVEIAHDFSFAVVSAVDHRPQRRVVRQGLVVGLVQKQGRAIPVDQPE